jgi:thiol-disulfide isomerase/thioredoxin
MISTTTFVLAALLAGSGQTILLDFYSDSCAPCVSMEPTLRRLASEGFDVRRVHVQQQQQLVRRFGIKQVPTYIALVEGREVDRVVGPTSYQRLRQMLASGEAPATRPGSMSVEAHPAALRSTDPAAATPHPVSSAGDPQQRALHASVRLRVEDPTGNSFGTGTIIHSQGEEALVITCGHLFRDSSGQGRIQVDLFAPGARNPVAGQLLCYDLKNDVALVIIWPGMPVTPVQVAPENHRIQPGDRVFSIGCDRGADATIRVSQVNSVNKYLGPANIQVAGQPVIGRSGGGLFTANGQLIGICNLADPQDDEGIYAALSVVHDYLAANLPPGVLQQDAPMVAVADPAPAPAIPLADRAPPPAMPRQMPSLPPRTDDGSAPAPVPGSVPATNALAAILQQGGAGAEVICIVRSKDAPDSPGQLIIIDQPTRELLDFLAAHQQIRAAQPTVLQAGQTANPIATAPDRIGSSARGPVLRGQAQ